MPQMAPLNWISLFTYFTLIFFLILVLIYSSFNKTPLVKTHINKKTQEINWKW